MPLSNWTKDTLHSRTYDNPKITLIFWLKPKKKKSRQIQKDMARGKQGDTESSSDIVRSCQFRMLLRCPGYAVTL